MKYKLINSVTKKETICDKVTIGGFDYYVSDNKPKLGDFYVDDTNQIRQGVTDDEEYWDRRSGYKIIIATTNPNIDIPKVVDGIEKEAMVYLDRNYSLSYERTTWQRLHEKTYKAGYNKSQETHPFSEEDMVEFGKHCIRQFALSQNRDESFTKRLLPEWREQKPKTVYYA